MCKTIYVRPLTLLLGLLASTTWACLGDTQLAADKQPVESLCRDSSIRPTKALENDLSTPLSSAVCVNIQRIVTEPTPSLNQSVNPSHDNPRHNERSNNGVDSKQASVNTHTRSAISGREERIFKDIEQAIQQLSRIPLQQQGDAKERQQVVDTLSIISWRAREISWTLKYKHLEIIPEKAWHALEYLCEYLVKAHGNSERAKERLKALTENIASVISELSTFSKCLAYIQQPGNKQASTQQAENKQASTQQPVLSYGTLLDLLQDDMDKQHLQDMKCAIEQLRDHKASMNFSDRFHIKAILQVLITLGEKGKRLSSEAKNCFPGGERLLKKLGKIRDLIAHTGRKLDQQLMKEVYEATLALGSAIHTVQSGGALPQAAVLTPEQSEVFARLFNCLKAKSSSSTITEQLRRLLSSLDTKQEALWDLYKEDSKEDAVYKAVLGISRLEFERDKKAMEQASKASTPAQTTEALHAAKEAVTKCIKDLINSKVQDPDEQQRITQIVMDGKISKSSRKELIRALGKEGYEEVTVYKQVLTMLDLGNSAGLEKITKKKKIAIKAATTLLQLWKEDKQPESGTSLGKLADKLGTKESNLLKFPELRKTMQKLHKDLQGGSGIDNTHFNQLRANPWLLRLRSEQCQLLKRGKAARQKREAPQEALKSMDRILKDLNELATLANKFGQQLNRESLYYLAAQKIFMDIESKVDRLKGVPRELLVKHEFENISSRQLWLLRLLRNKMAHDSTWLTPAYLSWFLNRWTTLSPAELRKHREQVHSGIATQATIIHFEDKDITREDLVKAAAVIRTCASKHGFKNIVQVHGNTVGAPWGEQSCLNLLVRPEDEKLEQEKCYDLSWELSWRFNCSVEISTPQMLRAQVGKTLTQQHFTSIIHKTDDVLNIRLDAEKEAMLKSPWYEVVLDGKSEPVKTHPNPWTPEEIRKVRAIHSVVDDKQLTHIRAQREAALQRAEVKTELKRLASSFAQSLARTVPKLLANTTHVSLVLKRVRDTVVMNQACDRYYEKHRGKILKSDKQMTRHAFRDAVKHNTKGIHKKPVDSKGIMDKTLGGSYEKYWDNKWRIGIDDSDRHCVDQLLYLFDEIRSPEIIDAFASSIAAPDQKIAGLITDSVISDFEQRFLDPHENTTQAVGFAVQNKPARLPQGVYKHIRGINIVDFTAVPNFRTSPSEKITIKIYGNSSQHNELITHYKDVKIKEPLHREVLGNVHSEVSKPLIDDTIDFICRLKVQYASKGERIAPADKVLTTENLHSLMQETHTYQGKLQWLDTKFQEITRFSVSTLDELLEAYKVSRAAYHDFEKDAPKFSAYHELSCLIKQLTALELRYMECGRKIRELRTALDEHKGDPSGAEFVISTQNEIGRYESLSAGLRESQGILLEKIVQTRYLREYANFHGHADAREALIKEIIERVYQGICPSSAQWSQPNCLNLEDYKEKLKQELESKLNNELIDKLSSRKAA